MQGQRADDSVGRVGDAGRNGGRALVPVGRRDLVRVPRPEREPLPPATELASAPIVWLVFPAVGLIAGNMVSVRLNWPYVWILIGVLAGIALAWLGPLLLGAYRRQRIGTALRSTRIAGTVGYVEWHRRRGTDQPYLMVADSRAGQVLWCIPLLRRPHLPSGVGVVRVHGGLRPGHWAVPFVNDRPLWPITAVRHRPLWTSRRMLGQLPSITPSVPRPRRPDDARNPSPSQPALLPADAQWQPVRLSLKRTADRVAVVAYELHTGRVLDSGFLPRGIGPGRAPEQNGLYACGAQRQSLLYGPGWTAVAVLASTGSYAVPVRPPGLAR